MFFSAILAASLSVDGVVWAALTKAEFLAPLRILLGEYSIPFLLLLLSQVELGSLGSGLLLSGLLVFPAFGRFCARGVLPFPAARQFVMELICKKLCFCLLHPRAWSSPQTCSTLR